MAVELITDQLPMTPSRKVPPQFGARIVAGAGTYDTAHSIHLAKAFVSLHIHAVLLASAQFLDIGAAQRGCRGVVGADCLPRVAETGDVARKNPGADVDAGARIEEVAFADAVPGEGAEPARVCLYEPVTRADRAL